MKKTYINPEIKIVMVNVSSHLLAGSDMQYKGNYDSHSVTMGSRNGGFWDDEDEE